LTSRSICSTNGATTRERFCISGESVKHTHSLLRMAKSLGISSANRIVTRLSGRTKMSSARNSADMADILK